MLKAWGLAAAGVLTVMATAARADQFIRIDDMARALGAAEEAIEGQADPDHISVIVLDDTVDTIGGVRVFGRPAAVKLRATARADQLARFTYIDKMERKGDRVSITFEQPWKGDLGVVELTRTGDDGWMVTSRQTTHSTSRARYFYGQLFDGEPCRDGTEMAERWNAYIEIKAQLEQGRTPTAGARYSKVCPGAVFPEVRIYRDSVR